MKFDDGWLPEVKGKGLPTERLTVSSNGGTTRRKGGDTHAGVHVRLDGSNPQDEICFLNQRLDGRKRVGTHCRRRVVINELLESAVSKETYYNNRRS